MGESELNLRLAALLTALAEPTPLAESVRSLGRLPGVGRTEYDTLYSDLSAAESAGQAERLERLDGAACYLATCQPSLAARIYENWRSEAAYVRLVRQTILSPPSQLTDPGWPPDRWPTRQYWQRVRIRLSQVLPRLDGSEVRYAALLEKAAWDEARKSYWQHPRRLAWRIDSFWDYILSRLTSGFPYYAFQSRFIWWWKQCLMFYPWPMRKMVQGWIFDEVEDASANHGEADAAEGIELTLDQLRLFREGYRLVRSTFFRRSDRQETRPAAGAQDPGPHEEIRSALDAVWYSRLERMIDGDLPAEAIRSIGERFPGLTPQTLNNLSHRLRLRMWAYALARIGGLSDSRLETATAPPQLQRRGAGPYPLAGNGAALTVAAFARTAPPKHSLLWALTAKLFLHPTVEPQRPDFCSMKRYLRELWYWLNDETLATVVQGAVADGSRADAAAWQAMQQQPLFDLARDLQALSGVDQLEAYVLARSGADDKRIAYAIRKVVRQLAGRHGIHFGCRRCLTKWRRSVASREVVPIWYLTAIQEMEGPSVVRRLRTDTERQQPVQSVAEAMNACRQCPPRGHDRFQQRHKGT